MPFSVSPIISFGEGGQARAEIRGGQFVKIFDFGSEGNDLLGQLGIQVIPEQTDLGDARLYEEVVAALRDHRVQPGSSESNALIPFMRMLREYHTLRRAQEIWDNAPLAASYYPFPRVHGIEWEEINGRMQPAIKMEVVSGHDLDRMYSGVEAAPDVPTQRLFTLIASCAGFARAYDYVVAQMKESGWVLSHRDFSLNNLMLNSRGELMAIDLGLAYIQPDYTPGIAFGTPKYIAPEQARYGADDLSHVDQFSFAAVIVAVMERIVGKEDLEHRRRGDVSSYNAGDQVWETILQIEDLWKQAEAQPATSELMIPEFLQMLNEKYGLTPAQADKVAHALGKMLMIRPGSRFASL